MVEAENNLDNCLEVVSPSKESLAIQYSSILVLTVKTHYSYFFISYPNNL